MVLFKSIEAPESEAPEASKAPHPKASENAENDDQGDDNDDQGENNDDQGDNHQGDEQDSGEHDGGDSGGD